MNALISALLWCAIQVTVLTCGAAVVYLAARRLHPRAGAAAAGGGLLMVIALTVMAASPWPRWSFSDGSERGDVAVAAASVKSKASVGPEDGPPTVQPGADVNLALMEKTAEQPSYWSLFVDAINRPQEFAGSAGEVGAKPQTAVKWPRVVVWIFLVGGFVAAGRLAWGVASVQRLARSGRAVDDSRVESIVREMQRRLDLAGAVMVRESDVLATPAMVGWRRPVVLLPNAWREWSDAELRAVIAHELAHVAGRDYAAWFVARLAVVAHFYHPLVRWLATRLQLEQELAADMAAARVVGDPKQYLHILAALALATPPHRMAGPARTLFPSRSLLVRRVEMLRSKGMSRPRRGAARYATFIAVALVGLSAAGLRGPGNVVGNVARAEAPVPKNKELSAEQARQVKRRELAAKNLQRLAVAMLNYQELFGNLPAASSHTYRIGGKILESKYPHSWRIELLPFLELKYTLRDQYHFDEPWDSEANRKMLAQMPDVFRSPFDEPGSANTSYFVLNGPDTAFPGEVGIRLQEITDGTSKTFSIVEAQRAVPWTKPEDIEYAADKPVPKLGGWVPGEFLAGAVDGSVYRVSSDIDETTLRAWITRNGREVGQELPRPELR